MNNEEVENNDEIPGEDFLEKNDEQHKDLLRTLNRLLNNPLDPYGVNNQDKIAKFAKNHYNTFIARMQAGLPLYIFRQLLNGSGDKEINDKRQSILLKILKQANKKGMVLALQNGNIYFIDTKDKDNKTDNKTLTDMKEPNKIVVTAHPYMHVISTLKHELGEEGNNLLHLYPLNDKFLSFISSRQTESVENTCKIINYFTKNKKMNVTLEGGSQGVDYITKMVGSTHGREDTRIKNAEITLNINKPYLFQDEYKIFQRLRNTDNSNNIAKISFGNTTHNCLHPKCKKESLKSYLKSYKHLINKKIEIEDLEDARPNQQNTLY